MARRTHTEALCLRYLSLPKESLCAPVDTTQPRPWSPELVPGTIGTTVPSRLSKLRQSWLAPGAAVLFSALGSSPVTSSYPLTVSTATEPFALDEKFFKKPHLFPVTKVDHAYVFFFFLNHLQANEKSHSALIA